MLQLNFFLFCRRIISLSLISSLALGPTVSYAQSAFISTLPEPGTMVSASTAFTPVLVKGLVVHPDRPLNFDFIVDSGNDSTDQVVVKEQSQRMAQYFLAAITVPEEQLWVNLSPYEKDRVIENELGQTVLGRDMLAQDYILKQLTSSLIYPEKGLGKEFWARVYAEAQAKFGTADIPVDTFNKVWIMPEKAEVFEKGNAVYVTDAKLKVMLDGDRTAMTQNVSDAVSDEKSAVAKTVMREIVLPAIEKEVNEGKNFAAIRQVYYAAILAKWYRELIQNTLLADAYVGKNKVAGVTADEKALKEEIYQRYIAAYKKGVFNYIKEEADVTTGVTTPRKYFSGGIEDFAMKNVPLTRTTDFSAASRPVGQTFKVDIAINNFHNAAMGPTQHPLLDEQFKQRFYIPGQVKQTKADLGGFLYTNFEYGFVQWGETEVVVRLKDGKWNLERDQWVTARGGKLVNAYKDAVDELFKDEKARAELTTEQMYAKLVALRRNFYPGEFTKYETDLQQELISSGGKIVEMLRAEKVAGLSLKDAVRAALFSDYGDNVYEQSLGAKPRVFDSRTLKLWLEDLSAIDDIDAFLGSVRGKDYIHVVGSVNSLAADMEIFGQRLLVEGGVNNIVFVVKEDRIGMDATKADIDALLAMPQFKSLQNNQRFKVVVSGSDTPGTNFNNVTTGFQTLLNKVQAGDAVLGLKGEQNNHTADSIAYDHYRFLLSRMIDTRRKMGIFWDIDQHEAPPVIALRVPAGIAISDRWHKSIYASHFHEARDWFESHGGNYADLKKRMLDEGLHFVEAAYPEALVAPMRIENFKAEYEKTRSVDPGLTIVGFARQKRLELLNAHATKIIGKRYIGNIYSLEGDGTSSEVGNAVKATLSGQKKVLVNGGVFDSKQWSIGVIRAGAVGRAYDPDASRELLAHEYVLKNRPNAQVTFNGLYFFTPTLLEIYNRYRADKGRSDEVIQDTNFYLDAYSQEGVETIPLYNKGYFGMKDGKLVFGQRRLLGGEMTFRDKRIQWTADQVVDGKEKTATDQGVPVIVYSPMMGESIGSSGVSARDNGYTEVVGYERINLVVVNNQIKFIKRGSVLLPSMGIVISLDERTFEHNFGKINIGTTAYKENLPEVEFKFEWPGNEQDRPEWYLGGGTILVQNGHNLVENKNAEYENLKKEGWFNKLSMQTQETQVQDWVRGPRMVLGVTKSGKAFSYAFSGRTDVYAGTNFGEAIVIIERELAIHGETIKDAINLDGGSSVSFNVRGDDNKEVTLSWPATGPDNIEGVVRPVSNIVYFESKGASVDGAMTAGDSILQITDPNSSQIGLVGGKAASLKELGSIPGVSVPAGFNVTTNVYADYLEQIGAAPIVDQLQEVSEHWKILNENDSEREVLTRNMRALAIKIHDLIMNGEIPAETKRLILASYKKLEKDGQPAFVAVRSSATAEDMPNASFAGQYTTYLNIQGDDQIIKAIKGVWASTYFDEAKGNMNPVEYRNKNNLQHSKNKMCALILEMVNPQSAGTAFSVDLETGAPFISINNSYGLGEAEVSGIVTSDTWIVDPNTGVILKRRMGEKGQKIVYDPDAKQNVTVDVSVSEREKYAISKEMAREIALLVKRIQDHYVKKNPNLNHMDVEYAVTYDGRIVFTQARPETVWTSGQHTLIAIDPQVVEKKNKDAVKANGAPLYPEIFKGGVSGSPGVARGVLRVVSTVAEAEEFVKPGDIMVAPNTTNAWEHVMGRASGIITEIGGPGNHTAVVSREQKKAAIVGAVGAMQNLGMYEGRMVTIDATSKRVYLNSVPQELEYSPDKIAPVYGDRFSQTLDDSWEEAKDTMTTTNDPDGTRWINKPNQSVRLFLQTVFARSHQEVARQLNPGHTFRDRINKEGKYQVNFDDIFPWMERLAKKPLEGSDSLSSIHESRVANIRDFLKKSENLTLTTESVKAWLDSFVTLNGYMGYAYNMYRITEGLMQDALKRKQIPEPYLSQVWLSMAAWVGDTEAVERNRDYGRLLEEIKKDGDLRKDLKLAVEAGKGFDAFSVAHPEFYAKFDEHAFNYKIVKNTDDIFTSAPFHSQLAKELLKDASDNRTITIYNTKPEQFYPDDPEFTRIARLAFFASKLRQDAHHFKVRGQWKFVEVLRPLAAFLIEKGEIKAFGDIFDHTPEWIIERVGEYEKAGRPAVAAKPLFHIKPYEIQDLAVTNDAKTGNETIDDAMMTSMGRWQFEAVQWDQANDRLTLLNATRIEGAVKPEFLENGKHDVRDIVLATRVLNEQERARIDGLAGSMGVDIGKVVVIRLEQTTAFHRIYGLYAEGISFIREDVLSEGNPEQIREALDHLRLKSTGLGYEELKKIQYHGDLRSLITKLSHRTIKQKLLFRLYGEKEASRIIDGSTEATIKDAILKAILNQLGDQKTSYQGQIDRLQSDVLFYDGVTREMVRNKVGFLQALSIVDKMSVVSLGDGQGGRAIDSAQNGGIDIQNIDVVHKNGSAKIQFNDQAVRDVLKGGFNGFTPIIINITPIQSPLMVLGEQNDDARLKMAAGV